MKPNIEVLDKTKHGALKLKKSVSVKHIENQNVIPLVAREWGLAGSEFPVMFVKDAESGNFRSMGIVGFKEGENLVFQSDNVKSKYMPLEVQRAPFSVALDGNSDRYALCLDTNSDQLTDGEGDLIIEASGELSERAKMMQGLIHEYVTQEKVTQTMLQRLDELELIVPAQVAITLGEEKMVLNGLYRIDDKKLAELADDLVIELHRKNYFSAIYAHLHSLGQMQNLISLRAS